MGFLATLPASLLSALGSAFFKSLFETLFGFIDKKDQDSTHEELGGSRVREKVNQTTAETMDAMNQVPRPSDAEVEKGLADGTF